MKIIGISAYYHDSAAALIVDGNIIAAAQEERFTRKKHDAAFPAHAVKYCLEEANCGLDDIDYVIFYDKPLVKFERLLETYLSYAPSGFQSFLLSMPVWLKDKLYLKATLKKEFTAILKERSLDSNKLPPLLFNSHHKSHAASAFYPSPFEQAAVVCLDGVGEWATTSVWLGQANKLEHKWEINFPHSLGLLYSAFTYYTGFKVNSGEYKLMGLAPYGEPVYVDLILNNLIDVKDDGSYRLDMSYFNYATGLTMTNKKFDALFGGPPRAAESEITQREMDLARSIQVVTEEIVLKIAKNVHQELAVDNLCLAGGVALNCVSNGRLLRESPFKNIWIQPAAGDAGGALGAALTVWHQYLDQARQVNPHDSMQGSYLGPKCKDHDIQNYLDSVNARYQKIDDGELMPKLADILSSENVVGWCQGRMEFGPRSLGSRSILGDPRSQKMQSIMNLKIKYRESFRPFAPAVKAEKVSEWFEIDTISPYMLLVAPVKSTKCFTMTKQQNKLFGIEKLNIPRSEIPSVTHVDYSARIQTVHKETNPRFYQLIDAFEQKTNYPVLVNTSFNVRGEPIVRTAEDAYRCFMRTEMDYLVIENYLLAKTEQPEWSEQSDWRDQYELD
ncbi:MAG: carbamoyltransferase [Gammaproteobacteria bacterium]|nr:carbamoyltransferase [Gammaproteobacteria bacterium]